MPSVLSKLYPIFLQALFRASLPHPTSDRDYALYDVGEGCEVTNLVPGIDFLSDRFRCSGRCMVAALRWVSEELARGRHNLYVSVRAIGDTVFMWVLGLLVTQSLCEC